MFSRGIARIAQHTSEPIRTAGCIIIGDEILNSKIVDTNSRFFARICYEHGVSLKKIAVVGDVEEDIASTVQEFNDKFDFTVTSGGVGCTHDDITYRSVAKAYGLPLAVDQVTLQRARKMGSECVPVEGSEDWEYFKRMVELPKGAKTLFSPTSWTPVVEVEKVYVLPGVPKFFEELVTRALLPNLHLAEDPYVSKFVVTHKGEVEFSKYLEETQEKVLGDDIKLGSYPHYERGVGTISITGRKSQTEQLIELTRQIAKALDGKEVSRDEEFALTTR